MALREESKMGKFNASCKKIDLFSKTLFCEADYIR